MVGKIHVAIVGFFSVTGALGATRWNLRRDETPSMSYDPETTSYCTWWWDNDGSIACENIPSAWGISLADFRRWNPSITETCGNLLADRSYCVEAYGEPAPTTSAPTTTTTAGAPGPTQPGQIDSCNRWDLVESGNTCDTFTNKYPGLTRQLLVEWNSEIGAQCQYLWVDYYICTGIKGWTPSGTTSGTTPTATNGIPTPTPIQPGMIETCNKFHLVSSGDDCGTIASKYGISRADFLAWNSGVGAGCGSLWLDYYVCVSIVGSKPSTTTSPTSPTNGVTTPTPIRPGMVANCDKFHMVVDGDECRALANSNGITLDQLVTWNPEVKADCSGLWLGYYICVKVIGVKPTATTTTGPTQPTNGVATPTPILPGMVANCDKFHMVVDGDQCGNIAQKYGISQSQFTKWNPQVGSGCSGLWLGYYVCVKTIGTTPTITTTTTTTGNGITTPTPTRPGIVGNCDAFHKVKSGDTCDALAGKYGITTNQLYTWNTQIGTNCGGLWVDYYICVSIVGVNPKPTTTTTTTTTKGNGVATPTPIQTGMTGTCNKFYKVVSGDSCETIAKKAGVTLANFYAWNKGVGSSCQTLWLGYYVCTGVK
ncbi:uncharacterized protein N7500_006890 [Penicillium coprophilum]|uniref:uncharacterized protein n=1 Tax=Penicillium coprophilum TaxID=36646 RepID=UPI0023875914|nr:uncharacterized protein N7500_006890 [Penicillium coprophilum]KAJ5165060.1 hypothetical protein N7500_006890 [Penicillium coprophilum]